MATISEPKYSSLDDLSEAGVVAANVSCVLERFDNEASFENRLDFLLFDIVRDDVDDDDDVDCGDNVVENRSIKVENIGSVRIFDKQSATWMC